MKRLLCLSLILFVILFISACSDPAISEKQASKNLEKVFDDVKTLPMDIEKAKENMGKDVLVSTEKKDGSNNMTELVVGDGVVLYYSSAEGTSKTLLGHTYTFTLEVMHFGGAEMEGDECTFRFTGANILATIEAENAAAVKAELLRQLEREGISDAQKSVMEDLFDGKQVYAAAGSETWDMYAQVNEEIKTTYDAELGTFWQTEEPRYDEWEDQYSYEVKDFAGRVKQRVYYKVDDAGQKWTTEFYEFTYLPDGTVRRHSTDYYAYTTQIWSENEYLEYEDTTHEALWYRNYQDNGVLESEFYYNEEGNEVYIDYFSDGSIYEKRIQIPAQRNEGRTETIYSEQYSAPGVLFEKHSIEDDILTRERFFDNGNLREKTVLNLLRRFSNGETYIIEAINGFENGSKNVFTYHNNGATKSCKQYDERGNLTGEIYYDENRNIIRP